MKSKVFVSCGQHSESERAVARDIRLLLEGLGFAVYVAVDVQTVLEINQRIIGELKNSDHYLFVNFCRDLIGDRFRGSLFSNQEFAIAYGLGFERLLVINQEGIAPEGMLRYIGVNTETFKTHEQCVPTVARALERAGWTPDYARRLVAGGLRFSDCPMRYGTLCGRFLYLDVHNHRPDVAALEATGRLVSLMPTGGQRAASPIRSPLNATGRPGSLTRYSRNHMKRLTFSV